VLVPHHPLRRVDEIVTRLPESPAEVHVLADPLLLPQSAEFQIGRPSHQQVTRGDVEGVTTFSLHPHMRPHIQRRGDFLIAIER
jgi:hypothetical protein